MREPLDLNGDQRLLLCDNKGCTVGIVFSQAALDDMNAERDRLRAEVERLRAEARELQTALDAARQEVRDKAAITAERDQYLKSLHALLRDDVQIVPEDIADMESNGIPMSEIIAEIENDLRSRGMLDAG